MSVLADRSSTTWFRTIKRCSSPRTRLLCFPRAGGAASFFRSWADDVPDGVEAVAVRYPGREDRLFDAMADSIEDMAGSVAEACRGFLGTPLALFGHSMGASVAHETALRLQEEYGTRPAALFVSARTAPGRPHHPFSYTEDSELLEHVRSLGGTAEHTLRDPEVLDLVLPSLRGDYRLVGKYEGTAGRSLQTPVVAYYGTRDAKADRDALACWSDVTGGSFTLRAFPGDHFYLVDNRRELLADLFAHLGHAERGVGAVA
ncbi:thioesterase II family protein [Streptomyces sp. C10-9-1]|uniref:thioesterase II family protein n=1 Tax=Streptomyces sp. C10-9-1 TaxID=1859285 RepID=UPI003F4A16EF